jgi:hypothetical protein
VVFLFLAWGAGLLGSLHLGRSQVVIQEPSGNPARFAQGQSFAGSVFCGKGRGLGAGGLLVGWGSCTSKSGSRVECKKGAGSCGDSSRLGGRSVSSERFVLSVFER